MKPILRTAIALVAITLVVGCAGERLGRAPDPAIPERALPATQGVGRLFFRASDDGVVYVYDADTARFVFAAPIRKDQRFILEPQRDLATVEGQKVYEQPVARTHTHRVYFEPYGKYTPPKPPEPATPLELGPNAPPSE